jgi:RNA polymerase sigma-70 factor (ECF subfamily)
MSRGTDLSKFTHVVLWCKKYSVPMGTASLAARDGMIRRERISNLRLESMLDRRAGPSVSLALMVDRSEPRPAPGTPPPVALARQSALRARLVARDERALVELIELATPWLLGLVQGMLRDQDEAEEVVAQVFATAWDRVGTLGDEHETIMPWLLRIARNRAIDRLRRRSRLQRKAVRLEAFEAAGPTSVPFREPDEAAQPGWHVHRSIHAALADLPEEQRAVVQLAYFAGLTHSEIARELGIPMGTVKTRLRLAFDKLRTALAPIRDWVP